MDMLKVVKIRSVENADYTTQYNRMRFKVPADNLNTHLDESYLSLQVQPKNANGTLPAKNLNIGFGNGTDKLPYYPTCLIKVARLFSGDSNIPFEEINRFNLLDLNMKIYQKDLENLASDQYESGFFVDNLFQADKSPFYLEGGIDIHVPLKDIFGLCKNKDFYLSNTGGLQIELELEDQYSLFIANSEANVASQRVYTSFDGGQSVTPFSNLNSAYISSSQPPNEVAPVALDSSEVQANQELKSLDADLENFYISASSVTIGSTYDATNKRFPVAIQISLTSNIIYDASLPITAFGIGTVAGNLILKNSNWKQMPMSLVYKKTDTVKSPLFARELQNLTASLTDFNPSGTPTNAVIVAQLPWVNDTAPTGLSFKAIACAGKLSLYGATSSTFNQLSLTNAIGSAFPIGYAGIAGTIQQICAGTGNPTADPPEAPALTLALGTDSTYPTITVSAGALGSGVSLVPNAQYIVNLQQIQPATFSVWNPSEVKNDDNINGLVPWTYQSNTMPQAKNFILKATDETVLTFQKVVNDSDAGNVAFINKQIQERVQQSYASIGEIFLQMVAQPPAPISDELDEVQQAQLTYSIPRAELVLVQEPKKSSDSISNVYMTWKMEPTLIENSTTNWQKQFILEPNVASVCLLYPPQASNGVQSMYSSDDAIDTYRWALDNIDNTNRDVVLNEALHNDKLIDWFNNTNMKLKSFPNSQLLESELSLIPMKIYSAVDDENMYMDNKSHTLQVVLKAQDDTPLTQKNLYLFKQVLKTL